MMYFHLHPVKVVLLDMGQIPKRVKYIRVMGDDLPDCYASFMENIRAIAHQESSGLEFVILWMDYASDEVELRNFEDFWMWLKFLEANKNFHPEVLIRPIFLMPAIPRGFPMPPCFPMNAMMNMNRPQFAPHHPQLSPQQMTPQRLISPNAPSFYPARFKSAEFVVQQQQSMQNQQVQQNVQVINHIHNHPEVNHVPQMNGIHPSHENLEHPPPQINENPQVTPQNHDVVSLSSLDSMDMTHRSSPPVQEKNHLEKFLKPSEKTCLRKFMDMGYTDQSGWLIKVIQQVEGDFERACTIVQENEADTDGTEN
ncbi:uncharacterized protein LOC134838110 [Culicoides brevitarsis]|uniref:uncharacterized protein LOC134838110 n=1 Tax=Culicoides brevitarsis TaxID=469753 RepID=UPI00307BD5FF